MYYQLYTCATSVTNTLTNTIMYNNYCMYDIHMAEAEIVFIYYRAVIRVCLIVIVIYSGLSLLCCYYSSLSHGHQTLKHSSIKLTLS